MANDGNASSKSEPTEPSPTPGKSENKSRSRRQDRFDTALERTAAGENEHARLIVVLTNMLHLAALVEANRRRASSIDTTDIQTAYDHVVSSYKTPKLQFIIFEIFGLVGGAFIGVAINIMTGGSADWSKAYLSLAAGIPLAAIGVVFKYAKITF